MKDSFKLIAVTMALSGCSHGMFKSAHDVRNYIDQQTKNLDVPGIQYVVVNDKDTVLSVASGFSDIAKSNRMQDATLMMAYSMTKTFIAILAIRLHQKGAIDIDKAVREYLPDSPYGSDLKISHLLSQSSGIPNPIPLKWAHLIDERDSIDEEALFWSRLKNAGDLEFSPGEKYSYSNLSYAMLGMIIEKVSQKPLDEVFYEEISSPLGIAQEEIGFKYGDNYEMASGYLYRWTWINFAKYFVIDSKFYSDYEKGWLKINAHYVDFKAMGGLIGSAQTFARVLQDLLRENSLLLDQASKKLLFSASLDNKGSELPMTHGWHIEDLDGLRFLYKEGGGAGFHCEMRIYPKKNIASVLMTNSTTFDVKSFLNNADPVFLGSQIND